MPWNVTKDARCPASRPWGVVKEGDGALEGCHSTEAAAHKQQAALYASEPSRAEDLTLHEYRTTTETWPDAGLELRLEGEGLIFEGYAAVFDSPSEPLPFVERIRPGAFAKSLRERRRAIKMFLNHNTDIVLGSTRAGTLTLEEDKKGLRAMATLPDNEQGRYVSDAIRRGDIDSMSFGFQAAKDAWSKDGSEREIIEARLLEVSPVTAWPAYPATSASVRELATAIDVEPDALADAFRILRASEATLTPEQHALLLRAINSRYPSPIIGPTLASRMERWAALTAEVAG